MEQEPKNVFESSENPVHMEHGPDSLEAKGEALGMEATMSIETVKRLIEDIDSGKTIDSSMLKGHLEIILKNLERIEKQAKEIK